MNSNLVTCNISKRTRFMLLNIQELMLTPEKWLSPEKKDLLKAVNKVKEWASRETLLDELDNTDSIIGDYEFFVFEGTGNSILYKSKDYWVNIWTSNTIEIKDNSQSVIYKGLVNTKQELLEILNNLNSKK